MVWTHALKKLFLKEWMFFLILICVALSIRFLLCNNFSLHGMNAWIPADSSQYYSIAKQVAAGNGFSYDGITPEFNRLPGYPLFLSVLMKCGCNTVSGLLFIQIILASFIPLLVFFLSVALFKNNLLARIASLWAAVQVNLVLHSCLLATESLCLLFLLSFFCLVLPDIVKRFNRQAPVTTRWRLLLAGILLGIVSVIRANGSYIFLLTFIFVFLMYNKTLSQKIVSVLWFSAGWGLFVAAWLIRNYVLLGGIFFHTLPGVHFTRYYATPILMYATQKDFASAKIMVDDVVQKKIREHYVREGVVPRYVLQGKTLGMSGEQPVQKTPFAPMERALRASRGVRTQGPPLNPYEVANVECAVAFEIAKKYPWAAAKHSILQMIKTVVEPSSVHFFITAAPAFFETYSHSSWIQKARCYFRPPLDSFLLRFFVYLDLLQILLMLFGFLLFILAAAYNALWRSILFSIAPYIAMLVVITLAFGCARLRIVFEPFLLITAVAGWMWLCTLLITFGKKKSF